MTRPYLIITVLLLPLLLSGCGPQVELGVAVDRMMEKLSEVKQVEAVGQLKLVGESETAIFNGLKELVADFTAKADFANLDKLRFSLTLNLSGQAPEGATKIGAEIRGLPDYTYFRVKEANAPSGSPLSITSDARWYKVKNPEVSSGNVLGGGNRLTNEDGIKIRELIRSAKLFTVQTVLSDEVIKGVRSYHLAALIDQSALSDLLDAIQLVTGERVVLDRAKLMRLASDYTYDLYISRRDYHLVKLIAHGNLSTAGQSESVLEILFSRFDSPVGVVAPSEVKEFNINDLLKSPLGQL
ncbi:hypothetical protein A2810_00565 [candidate division Kazan bacterium RIFCSPHIGHO2_01_FULL_49_10]|uniref:Uncharacterized protein n=1 Tax=candidate division Kazan bacterium RIFCSPLOWO2_01_FULL_48_13 TaxID=1798539 RepID=A0A1F4PMZ0_UNCK3|nr:MAG: hypothetical protein A2810_00565 [candidate division Kazan bacterium RIFCSPHIGHO2_01_FULL_49_10]OGB85051.1 MAG: hypothetical protein A2994_00345 [candidate division Kazan bacterium RIFCSPLOWO2_01_FULL_48_13]